MAENRKDNDATEAEDPKVDPVNLKLVMDVELNVSLRFGQRQMPLREVLELVSGSVIELDRAGRRACRTAARWQGDCSGRSRCRRRQLWFTSYGDPATLGIAPYSLIAGREDLNETFIARNYTGGRP